MNTAALVLLVVDVLVLVWSVVEFARIAPTPPSRRAIVAQYAPPAQTSVLAGGALIDDRRRSISGQLVDLTVRGHLSVIAPEAGGAYRLRFENSVGLDDVELAVVRAFFGQDPVESAVVTPNRGDTTLLQRLRWAQFRANSVLASSGLAITRAKRSRPMQAALILAVVLVPVSLPDLIVPAIGVAVFVAATILAGRRATTLTSTGVDVRDHIAGLRLFISLAEADRLRVLQSPDGALLRGDTVQLTERLLGWAVLFGLEREWAAALRAIDTSRGGTGNGGSADLALILALSADFSGAASDGNLGGDPDDPNTPDGSADTGDGGGSDGGDSSGGGDGGGDGGGGGGD